MAGIDSQEPLGSTLDFEREPFPDIKTDPLAGLGTGTHCVREKRTGNKCCSKAIYEMIVDVANNVATSPEYNTSCHTPGVIANVGFVNFQ